MKDKAEQLLNEMDRYVQYYIPWENDGGPSRKEMQLKKILSSFKKVAEDAFNEAREFNIHGNNEWEGFEDYWINLKT